MRIPAGVVSLLIVFAGIGAGEAPSLAGRLLAAPSLEAARQLLAEAPAGEVNQQLFATCRQAGENSLEKTRDLPAALRQFQISLAIGERLKSQAGIGSAWMGIGIVRARMRQAGEALASYEKGYPAALASGDKALLAHFLRARGVSYSLAGRFDESLADAARSLALYRELGDRRGQAMMLSNTCASQRILGNLRQAAADCEESYRLARTVPNAVGVGLANMGPVAAQQGNYPAARDYLEEAIRQYEKVNAIDRLSNVLLNISPVYNHLGETEKSFAVLARVLELTEKTGDTVTRAMALFDRAAVYTGLRRYDEAVADLKAGLKLQEKNDSAYETAIGLATLSQLETWEGQTEEACKHADQALAIGRRFRSPQLIANGLNARGACDMRRDRLPEARVELEEAIRQMETMRDQAGASEQEGQTMLADRIQPYRNLLSVLVEQKDLEAALNIAERSRARQLLDTVRRGKTQPSASMTPAERQEEKRLSDRVARLSRQMASASGTARAAMRREWDEARGDFDGFRIHLYASHPQLAASRGAAAPVQLAQTADLLPDNKTLLVEFAMLRLTFCVFTIERGASGKPVLAMHRVKQDREDLTKKVAAFRRQLGAHELGYRKAASELYQTLLGPVASQLAGKRTVVIVPDGPLWNLPFQALIGPDGAHLVERKSVFYAPSLTFLHESRKRAAKGARRGLLAMGNPPEAGLPNATWEVSSVARLYAPLGALALTGVEATKEAWLRDAPESRVLHIATHGVLNAANPMYSWLSLAGAEKDPAGATLEAREILGMNLNADLAVLSACDTARGQVLPGEGLVGMSWAFLAAGTGTAVVSQWAVDSAGTTALMLAFHRNLRGVLAERRARSRAGSLRQAVLELMKTPQYRHPYYWAGFVMIGNGY